MKIPVQVIRKGLVVAAISFLASCDKASYEDLMSQLAQLQQQNANLTKENNELKDEQNRKKLDKADLEKEIQRVAPIIQGVATNPEQLEKKIEELTPRGKDFHQALKGFAKSLHHRYDHDALRLYSDYALTNTDVAVLINHPWFGGGRLDGLQLSKSQLKRLITLLNERAPKSSHFHLGIRYDQLKNIPLNNLFPLFQTERRGVVYLNLTGDKVEDDQGIVQSLAQNLDKLVSLKYLRFNSTFLPLGPSLKYLPDLRYLDLGRCNLGDAGVQALAPCFNEITYLIGLDLSDNDMGLAGAQALAAYCKDLPNLRSLILDNNAGIGLEGIQALAPQLRHLIKLGGLSLVKVGVGPAGAKVLASYLGNLPQLKSLKLTSNNLGDEGLGYLIPGVQNLPKLDEWDLTNNHISSIGAQLLVKHLNRMKRKKFSLYLGGNELGDSGAEAFLKLSNDLQDHYICLSNNYIYENHKYLLYIDEEFINQFDQLSHIEWRIGGTYACSPLYVDSWAYSLKKSILGDY